jgi:dethiobiotin synthetase
VLLLLVLIQWIRQVQVAVLLVLAKSLHRVNKDLLEMLSHKEHLSRLKGLVSNHQQWDNFIEYIESVIESQHRIMEQSDDPVALHRAQGAVYQLRRFKLLREEVLSNG